MKLHPRLTAEGVLLARRAERFRPVAEQDAQGWVIGYGHRASAREGARVSEADATALLTYDLSESAGRVDPILRTPVPPALFDALNAHAFRVGPEAFARSEELRRVNAGEPVSPGEVAEEPLAQPPLSAVTIAAQAVRDRLSQVLTEREPLPPRAPRQPWPDVPITPATPEPLDPGPAPGVQHPDAEPLPADEAQDAGADSFDAPDGAALSNAWEEAGDAGSTQPSDEEPLPPPITAAPPEEPPHAEFPALDAAAEPTVPEPAATSQPDASWRASEPAALVSFARGGRPRLWERVRGNPYVYMAVGACGLVLFACALLGFVLGRPTGPGLALGVVGVICLAPALAFFLHRRGGSGEPAG